MVHGRHEALASLPAYAIAGELNRLLRENGRVIVTAPPGAGKSTVLPLTILDGLPAPGRILMLEPRRVAARQIAGRMAWLLGEAVGETVGYRMRFEGKSSSRTRIEVLTEGILTRMLVDDPGLEGVSVIVFDEFHERSLNCDEALALALQCQSLLREDLRIVLMSATLDADGLSARLDAPVLEGDGRMFPVDVVRASVEADPGDCVPAVARAIREAHSRHEGDILAFLPGEAEIRRCAESLDGSLGGTRVFPLYAMLPSEAQKQAMAPSAPGERKVVLATSIAETSITIEGVRVVVDSGLCRRVVSDAASGLDRMETVRISKDMAEQRGGRAGRVAPGVCYRLWSAATEAHMDAVRVPEILRADLCRVALDAAAWGEDMMSLPWPTPPPAMGAVRARSLLESMSAVGADGRITAHGKALAALPCHPRIAQMIVCAASPRAKSLAADLAALLGELDPLKGMAEVGVDLRLNALRRARRDSRTGGAWARVVRAAGQYARMARAGEDNSEADPYEVGALIAAAYPERVGQSWHDGAGRFRLSGGEMAALDPSDPLCACEWIAVADMHAKPGGVGSIFLAAPVSPDDLGGIAVTRENVFWDAKAGRAVARMETRVGVLPISSSDISSGMQDALLGVICATARKDGLSMFDFSDGVRELQRRICAAATWHPELGLPDVGDESILSSAGEWGPAFVGRACTVGQLKKIDMREVIWSRMTYGQRREVERLAPSHVAMPDGRRGRLQYRHGAEAPVLRVRLQECFGMTDTPMVDDGRMPVLMELLSPGYKPVQLTSDLRSFWSGTYFEVRKELRRRYPRHSWPDNPLEAVPTHGVKRRER